MLRFQGSVGPINFRFAYPGFVLKKTNYIKALMPNILKHLYKTKVFSAYPRKDK